MGPKKLAPRIYFHTDGGEPKIPSEPTQKRPSNDHAEAYSRQFLLL